MRTVFSIPDRVLRSADRAAKRLGVSRSEFFVRAVRAYVARHRRTCVTKRLNAIHGREDSRISKSMARAQAEAIGRENW